MGFAASVSFSDPTEASDPQDTYVQQALNDALGVWSQYINGVGTLNVQLNVTPLGSAESGFYTIADASPTTYVQVGTSPSGLGIYESSAVNELDTGGHAATSDITINFNSQLLKQLTSVQSDDIVQVFEHELMHGFGVIGFRDASGQLSGDESVFDSLSAFDAAGNDSFTGPAAAHSYGGNVPLTTQLGAGSNYYHVGAAGTAADPAVLQDNLIYPIFSPGQMLTGLDVAILEDIGVPISAAGSALIDPNPTTTVSELDGVGGGVAASAAIGGTTQPDEPLTIINGSTVLGTVTASAAGQWSFSPAGLADGGYVFQVAAPGASGTVVAGVISVVVNTPEAIQATFQQVVGQAPDAASLATAQAQLASGVPLASIRSYLASTQQAANAISYIFLSVLGRAPAASDYPGLQQALAGGATLAGLRSYFATTAEAGNAVTAVFNQVLGRAPLPGDVAGAERSLAGGASLAGIRSYLSTTQEAANAITAVFNADLGRAPFAAELPGLEQALANGASIANFRSYFAGTTEAANAIIAVFQATVGRLPSAADIASIQGNFAAGWSVSGLRSVLAASAEEATTVTRAYQNDLGRAATPADIAASERYIAGGGTLQALQSSLVGSTEFANDVGAATQAALGRPANAVEIAADRSQVLSSYSTAATIRAQVAELSGGEPPPGNGAAIAISPQTIAGSGPNLVYGLLNNDAVISAHPLAVSDEAFGGLSSPSITGFNPATDLIQVQSRQEASFAALGITPINGGASVYVGNGAFIDLNGVAPASLTAANFRFV